MGIIWKIDFIDLNSQNQCVIFCIQEDTKGQYAQTNTISSNTTAPIQQYQAEENDEKNLLN